MNTKHLFTVLGLGVLTVTLVALPGLSARPAEAAKAAGQGQSQAEASQQVSTRLTQLQEAFNNLDAASDDGDENVQVFLNPGGSWLGVGISEVTADKVKELKLPAERGVVIGKIVADSPAAKAGLKENDVVTEINGQRVEGTEQFRRMIREIPAGREAQLTVWRDGRAQTLGVTIGKSEMHHLSRMATPVTPGNFVLQMPELQEGMGGLLENGPWVIASKRRLGIDAEDVNGEFGSYFGAPDGEGILVRGVFSDSPAAKAGLKVGDVITTVDGERIRSVGELRAKIAGKGKTTTLKLGIVRNKAPLALSVELPAPEVREAHTSVRTNI